VGGGGQFEKQCVFNLDLKDNNDGEFLMSSGMLFQILGAATLKAREPK
jgi:ribosomal protein L2